MTDEQLRRSESRKARAAFEDRLTATQKAIDEVYARDLVSRDAVRVVILEALKREARIAERRTARRVGLR